MKGQGSQARTHRCGWSSGRQLSPQPERNGTKGFAMQTFSEWRSRKRKNRRSDSSTASSRREHCLTWLKSHRQLDRSRRRALPSSSADAPSSSVLMKSMSRTAALARESFSRNKVDTQIVGPSPTSKWCTPLIFMPAHESPRAMSAVHSWLIVV